MTPAHAWRGGRRGHRGASPTSCSCSATTSTRPELGRGRAGPEDVAGRARTASRTAIAVLGNHDWRAAGARGCGRALRGGRHPPCWRTRPARVAPGLWVAGTAGPAPSPRQTSRAALRRGAGGRGGAADASHDPDLFPRVPAARRPDRRGPPPRRPGQRARCCAGRCYRPAMATGTLPATWSRTAGISTSPPASAPPGCRCGSSGDPPGAECCGSQAARPGLQRRDVLIGGARCGLRAHQEGRGEAWRPRPRLAARVEGVVDPRERAVGAGAGLDRRQLPVARRSASDRPKRRCGQPPASPSSRGRCSSARSSSPCTRRTRTSRRAAPAAGRPGRRAGGGCRRRWLRAGRQGARRRSRTGTRLRRRRRAARGAHCNHS